MCVHIQNTESLEHEIFGEKGKGRGERTGRRSSPEYNDKSCMTKEGQAVQLSMTRTHRKRSRMRLRESSLSRLCYPARPPTPGYQVMGEAGQQVLEHQRSF